MWITARDADFFQVMIGFLVTAWITCIVAAVDTYCGVSKSFIESLSRSGTRNADEQLQKLVDRVTSFGLAPDFYNKHTHVGTAVQAVVDQIRFHEVVAGFLGFFRHERPRTRCFAKLTLDILCDLQVVTGTSIIVAGFVQINTMTFYHQQFVIDYWLLTLNSFWAARAGDLNQSKDNHNWHYWSRTAAIFCTIVLSVVFQVIVIPRQAIGSNWNPLESGSCYITHDASAYDQQYLWIAGLFLYAGYLFLVLISGVLYALGVQPSENETWMEKISLAIKEKEGKPRDQYKDWIEKFLGPVAQAAQPAIELSENSARAREAPTPIGIQDSARHRFPGVLHYFLKALFNLPLFISWIFRLFLALLTWGDSQSVLIVLAYFGFAAWSSYDIIDLKKSNTYLVQDESAWGFGQVLPVVLILLVFLNILDAIKGGLAISSSLFEEPLTLSRSSR